MTDREMLELAAKAGGISGYRYSENFSCMAHWNESDGGWFDACGLWSSLRDDGDAFRLAARLNMDIEINEFFVIVYCPSELDCIRIELEIKEEKMKTARLAITIAAAKAGKEMK